MRENISPKSRSVDLCPAEPKPEQPSRYRDTLMVSVIRESYAAYQYQGSRSLTDSLRPIKTLLVVQGTQ